MTTLQDQARASTPRLHAVLWCHTLCHTHSMRTPPSDPCIKGLREGCACVEGCGAVIRFHNSSPSHSDSFFYEKVDYNYRTHIASPIRQ